MPFVTFIVALVCFVVAAYVFYRGLLHLQAGKKQARGTMSAGFLIGIVGLLASVIIFGFFNV